MGYNPSFFVEICILFLYNQIAMIHLLLGGNAKVQDDVLLIVLSYLAHNDEPVTFHFLTFGLPDVNPNFRAFSDEKAAYLDKLLKERLPGSAFIKIDAAPYAKGELIESRFVKTHYGPYALLRLYADLIPSLPEKLLYIDCDVLFSGNVSSMYHEDLEDYEFAACYDQLGTFWIAADYQNSGVLLMNMPRIKETGLLEKCRAFLMKHKPILFDQDALNKLVLKKKFLPQVYNEQKKERDETIIRHFSRTIRWIPFFHLQTIKPREEERVHKVLKNHYHDDIYAEYHKIEKDYHID